ncbi:MAG: PTS sugar transporter subunit IIB [Tractidigestivibacter sp.]|uniref:PTS sugar transporter subunit IIB n=1 Tax=Tractidigestivibacter sp. TaxID=2847320 RepID=UPI003D90FA64
MAAKRVLVACGNGVATSTVVASKVKDYCAQKGINIQVTQCKMLELHGKANDYDLVITSGKFSDPDIKTPIIMAINLLTGINEQATLDKIVDALKD